MCIYTCKRDPQDVHGSFPGILEKFTDSLTKDIAGCPFPLLIASLAMQLLILIEIHLYTFSFIGCVFGVIPKKHTTYARVLECSPMFPTRHFEVSRLTCRPSIHCFLYG